MKRQELAVNSTKEILEKMGFKTQVTWVEEGGGLGIPMVVVVVSNDSGLLIGKQGETLDCLERLVRMVVQKESEPEEGVRRPDRFAVDINGYRRSQAETIIRLAREAAKKVSTNRRVESLAPMTAYERRIVHAELSSHEGIETESAGVDPQRRVLIKPVSSLGV